MNETISSVEQILADAVEIASPAERQAFVERACAGNTDLRAQVERLLANHDGAGSFLEKPVAVLEPPTCADVAEAVGAQIGPYKLMEQIGEGGMGLVYVAEQSQPVRRTVALKVIKPGMDSKQIIARFEAERQALALMDHPNIAKVLDAGATESGRPYFVMELIRGIPITEYCDQARFTVRQRLDLFIQVCRAVQHAHTKGIIHRDLKPTNVLVTSHDAIPVPKVIDFGVAKALGQQLSDGTVYTGFAQMIGTPLYMSPEQAEFNVLGVDTRSDIYSLGVLLYELLTGTTPFDKERLSKLGYDNFRKVIREEEPPRPSTRISTLGQAATTASTNRKSEPRKLSQQIRGELDWIVMKALEKDRNRRYETASAFAADVQRYLADEPVEACPPSAVYRFGKFARRNKAGLAVAAAAFMITTLLAAGAGIFYQREESRNALEREKLKFRQDQLEKDVTRLLDEVAVQRAKIHAKLADPIKVCELMSNVDGWQGTLANVRATWQHANDLAASNGDVLTVEFSERLRQTDQRLQADEADWKIAKELDDIRMTAATLVDGKWNPSAAAPKYEQFFRDRGFDWKISTVAEIASKIKQARLRYVLAGALDDWGNSSPNDRAQHLETVRLADPDPWRDQVRDEKHWDDLPALEKLAREADPGIQSPQILHALARRLHKQKGDASALLRSALIYYPQDFWLYFSLGNFLKNPDQKIGCFQAALALRPKSSPAHINLGVVLFDKNDLDGAIQHYRKAIDLEPTFALAHTNLGNALSVKKDLDGAIKHHRKAIELAPDSALAHNNLGAALSVKKDLDGAIRHYRKALELNPKYAMAHSNLGGALKDKMDFDGAIQHYRKALELNPNFVTVHNDLGIALQGKKDLDGAIRHYRKALELNPKYADARNNLGAALREMKDLDGAIRHFREALELDPYFFHAHYNLGNALLTKNDLDGAAMHFRKALKLNPNEAITHNDFGITLARKKDLDGAIEHFRKALELKPNWAEYHTNMGTALRDNGQFKEALEYMRQGHDLGSKRSGWAHPSAEWVQGCERLVKLDEQVPSVLKGEIQPASLQDWRGYADVCRKKKEYASAVEVWKKLFQKYSSVADSLKSGDRFRAALDAVLAAGNHERDAKKITDAERVAFRKHAQEWLHADLVSWRKFLENPQLGSAFALRNVVSAWQANTDLAGVRDEQNLAKLSDEERKAWQKLWAGVEQLRKQADSMFRESSRFTGNVTTETREMSHEVKLQAGKTYVIDLESKAFDTFLRLFDPNGKKLAENDDITPGVITNSRLNFMLPQDATYRFVVSAFENSGVGPYTLTIREFVK